MASSVFFRFKSQKEPTRVTFDGTGISVFELKREIISISRLGDGTNFELTLSSSDSNEEYDDDTTIIPRSTTVIARRLPAARPGKGGAARYVSGKMPVNAKSSRIEFGKPNARGGAGNTVGAGASTNVSDLQTEEERMAAVLQMGADQWQQQKAQMANATPVMRVGAKGKPANVPDHPPPVGYVCHRCLQKGHWIQACPTNDDPTFEGRPRIKRTTGIPKSFLRTVEKPVAGTDSNGDEQKMPSGVMVNAEGEYVVAEPDKASWEQYQAKANRSALAQQQAAVGSKELQDRGLECSIDKRMFVDPVLTSCCQSTYCNDCITTTLLDENLQCPNCGTENVSIDDLKPNEDMKTKIRTYQEEKAAETKKSEENAKSSQPKSRPSSQDGDITQTNGDRPQSRERTKSPSQNSEKSTTSSNGKKRKAETELQNDRKTPNPAAENKDDKASFSKPPPTGPKADAPKGPQFPPELEFMNQAPFTNGNMMGNMNMNMNMFPNMPNMNMTPQQQQQMWNMMMMNSGMGNQWGGGMPMNNNMYMNQQPNNFGMNGHRGNFNNRGGFGGQNRNNFNRNTNSANEDSPYFRQPVNPQRHQGRRNMQRPADYREI